MERFIQWIRPGSSSTTSLGEGVLAVAWRQDEVLGDDIYYLNYNCRLSDQQITNTATVCRCVQIYLP